MNGSDLYGYIKFMIQSGPHMGCRTSSLGCRVRATDRQCRQMRRNNKFGAKNMNLATSIGERKIAGENFCLASERLLQLKISASCRLMVINVYHNCQLTPQLSTTQFGS